MPRLARIHIFPFKSLDPQSVLQARLLASGALAGDRQFAFTDRGGDFINGKRTADIQRLRSHFDFATRVLSLRLEGTEPLQKFHLDDQRGQLTSWLSEYFGMEVSLIENADAGFPDDTDAPGPTVVSTATLETVCGWFEGISLDEARWRFRANLEIDGVEAFWEDRLVAEGPRCVRFAIGEAELLGTGACQRCPVPTRSPMTGVVTHGFAKTFSVHREAMLPAWAPADRFDHFYRLSVNTRRDQSRECTIRVRDDVRILEIV